MTDYIRDSSSLFGAIYELVAYVWINGDSTFKLGIATILLGLPMLCVYMFFTKDSETRLCCFFALVLWILTPLNVLLTVDVYAWQKVVGYKMGYADGSEGVPSRWRKLAGEDSEAENLEDQRRYNEWVIKSSTEVPFHRMWHGDYSDFKIH